MSPEQIEIERKAFEAEHEHMDLSGDIGYRTKRWNYDSPIINAMWSGWLARAEKAERVREALEATLASLEDCVDDSRAAVSAYAPHPPSNTLGDALTGGWCASCGCGNDRLKYAHLSACPRDGFPGDPVASLPTPPIATGDDQRA